MRHPRRPTRRRPAPGRLATAAVLVTAAALVLAAGCSSTSPSASSGPPGSSAAGTTSGSVPAASGPAGTAPAVDDRGAAVAQPTVRGPLTGGHGRSFGAMPPALADRWGYVEEEYLLEGEASAYAPAGPWATDGVWPATPAGSAPYVTRMVVRRPADPSRFDGTVLVEWLNVTSGQDNDVEFAHLHDELLAHGTVWVGVSAQKVGVEGGGRSMAVPGVSATPLKSFDADRYRALVHPGDDYSYDLFSQAAVALRRPRGDDPLHGLRPTEVLGAGESQAGARLLTYVDAIHPLARVYDGFLVHSRSAGGAVLRDGQAGMPAAAHLRADLDVPVLQLVTETDLFGLPFIAARQPDTPQLRTWEVAGTAHLDRELVEYVGQVASAAGATAPQGDPVTAACGPINAGPQGPVLRRGFADLRAWAAGGPAPAAGPPLEVTGESVARDPEGIALGGIRTPPVDAPVEVLRGDNASGGGYICSLFGSTTPLDAGALARRYPSHDAYVAAVSRSADDAVRAGHLLEVDAKAFVDEAQASSIGR